MSKNIVKLNYKSGTTLKNKFFRNIKCVFDSFHRNLKIANAKPLLVRKTKLFKGT